MGKMDDEETALLLVPVPIHEAGELSRKLNASGYQAVQFKSMEDVLNAAGLEPAEVDEVDLEMYDRIEAEFRSLAAKPEWKVQALAYIGLVLADIAKTHKRAMPPFV